MSESRVIRVGTSEAVAAQVEALIGRLGGAEIVRIEGGAAALHEAMARGDVDVVARATWDPPVLPAAGIELVAVPRRDSGEQLPPSIWADPPAPAALVLEMGTGADAAVRRRVAKLDHAPTRLVVSAERAVLAGVAAVHVPRVAVTAMREDGLLFVTATRYADDGTAVHTASHAGYPEDTADPAADLAARVVAELLGADPVDAVDPGGPVDPV